VLPQIHYTTRHIYVQEGQSHLTGVGEVSFMVDVMNC